MGGRNYRLFPQQCTACGRSGHNRRTCPQERRRELANRLTLLRAEVSAVEAALAKLEAP